MYNLKELIRDGIFDIELGVANPRTSGVSAGEGAFGYATDNSRWVKVGPNDTDWKEILLGDPDPQSVDNKTERLSLTGLDVGITQVIQDDEPNNLYLLISDDPSLESSWFNISKGIKNNFNSSVPPTSSNDSSEDYQVGSLWVDTTNNEAYRCVDSSVGGAVWIESTYDSAEVSAAIAAHANRTDNPHTVTKSQLGLTHSNTIYVAKNGTDTRTGIDPHDFSNPFLTVTAAQAAASSGDTILVLPGDYTAETALAGKDGVTYQGLDGAILPAFNVTTAITVKGSGLCQSLTCNNASAVMDMPGMDTVDFISCTGGTQTAGSAGTFIGCTSGTQATGNAGGYIVCSDGNQTIHLTNQTHNGASFAPVYLSSSANLNLYGDTSTSTESGGTVVDIENTWSGNLFIDGLKLVATTVATNEATTGITYGTGVTGTVQLKDCTIITVEDGTGTAKAIDAPSAQTVYVQGSLNITHAVDADITLAGGSIFTNANYV